MTENDANKPAAEVDTVVDATFAAARRTAPVPSDALMNRVRADALRVLAERPVTKARQTGLWAQLKQALGGWQGMGGLVTATCVGFWIGTNPPQGLSEAGDTLLGYDTFVAESEALSGVTVFGWDIEEG